MLRFLVIGLLYFWAVTNVNVSLMQVGLYLAVPLAFFFSFFCNKEKIWKNIFIKIFCFFLGWIILTWFTANNIEIATAHIQRLLGVFMMTIAICNMAMDKRNICWLYGIYVLVFFVAVHYAYTHILTIQFDLARDRLDDSRLNANVLACYTFYATFALFVLGELLTKPIFRNIFRMVFLLMVPLSFVIALLTASRQVLLVQVPLILILLYIRYLKDKRTKTRFVFLVGVAICFVISSDVINRSYDNSFLKVRNEKSIEDDGRFKVLKEAIDTGCDNPIVGVGPGNFILYSSDHIFSHCSYTEVFANDGMLGLFLYVFLLGYFLRKQICYYKYSRNTIYIAFITFGVIFVFYNFLYVFYSDLCLMSFFMFVAVNSSSLLDWNSSLERRKRKIKIGTKNICCNNESNIA